MSDDTFEVEQPEGEQATAAPGGPAKRRGLFGGLTDRITGFVARVLRGDFLNARNAAIGLAALLVLWLLLANLSPVRVMLWF